MVEAELFHPNSGSRSTPRRMRPNPMHPRGSQERLSASLSGCQAARMPAVLVHGVPETPAVWDYLRPELTRSDVVTPQFPGFGCARPDGFGATREEYVGWLIAELETLADQGPIDLVGHDWGGGLVVRVVSTRSDLVRSWVTDAAGVGDVDFEWHDFAKIWQTPGEGEQFYEQQMALSPEERGSVLEMFGIPADRAV